MNLLMVKRMDKDASDSPEKLLRGVSYKSGFIRSFKKEEVLNPPDFEGLFLTHGNGTDEINGEDLHLSQEDFGHEQSVDGESCGTDSILMNSYEISRL